MTLIAAAGAGDAGGANLGGIAASIGAGASYSIYTLSAKALMNRGWSADGTMGVVFGVAGLVSIPLLLLSGAEWMLTPTGLATAAWLGIVTTAIAYLCFGAGLAKLQAATVSTLTLAEPLTASILGLLVLREQLATLEALGLAVLAAGIVVLVLGSTGALTRRGTKAAAPASAGGSASVSASASASASPDSTDRGQR